MRLFAVKSTFVHFLLLIQHVICHLKDMGEVTNNWTHVVKNIEKRIVGGHAVSRKKHPYSVQLFNAGALCGGTILNYKTVLTAAHCFDENDNLAEMIIFSNPRFLFDSSAIKHEVWDYEVHEKYNNPDMFANDIAIVMIHDEFVYGKFVKKARLINTDVWMKENTEIIAAGWGETKYGEGLKYRYFQETSLYYLNKKRCMIANRVNVRPEMFCLFSDEKKDTCRGDSGGAVLWDGYVVGIVSHGRGCGEAPGIYINVLYFRHWIYRTVYKLYANYCQFHKNLK